MDEKELLGKLAYDAYQHSKYGNALSHITAWSELPLFWRQNWIDAAQAVAERVMLALQTSVEASE